MKYKDRYTAQPDTSADAKTRAAEFFEAIIYYQPKYGGSQ